MVPGLEVSFGAKPRDNTWAPSQFLPQLCGKLFMLEAFFEEVKDLLMNMCLDLLITEHPPWGPPQLIHIMIEVCDVLPGGIRSGKLHHG